MTTMDEIEQACDHIYNWHMRGLPVFEYQGHMRRGKAYMALLLDMKVADNKEADYSDRWFDEYNKSNLRLVEEINGPHGYAMLQAAIVKYKIHQRMLRKRYIRNKKARIRAKIQRQQQMEERFYAGLEID